MKKVCLLLFCAFLMVAAVCGCADAPEESSAPVSADESVTSLDAESSRGNSSDNGSEQESSDDPSSAAESRAESSAESSLTAESSHTVSAESSADESEESSADVSADTSSVEPDESSEEVSVSEPDESSREVSVSKPDESSEEASSDEPDESSREVSVSEPDESSEEVSSDEPDESSTEESSVSDESSMEESGQEQPPETSEDDEMNGIGDAEFLPTGYLLYNGAAYSQAYFSETQARRYADVYARYAELFPDVGIHVINHPLSAINITNPAVREMTNNQRAVLNLMEQCIYGDVNFVNLGAIFEEHRGEYLYFKSDYHWTQLGAYYAYCAFALSMGYEPTPLESFEQQIVNDRFIGRTNDYAHDDRILSFYDTVYAYMPIKEHTYAVYHSDLTLYRVYDNCIQTSIDNYSCFLTGDQAYAVINVPENDQDKTVLVIKDSSANAFVPFLAEHYGNIIIVDPRMYRPDVRKLIEEQGVDDIIFFATASTSNGSTYCDYYREMIR